MKTPKWFQVIWSDYILGRPPYGIISTNVKTLLLTLVIKKKLIFFKKWLHLTQKYEVACLDSTKTNNCSEDLNMKGKSVKATRRKCKRNNLLNMAEGAEILRVRCDSKSIDRKIGDAHKPY